MSSDRNFFSWFKILKYLKPYRWMLLGVFVSLIITSASVLLVGKAIQFLIDNGLAKGAPHMLNVALGYLLTLVAFLAAFTYLRFFLVTLVGERIIRDMRYDIYSKMLELSPSYYESKKVGDILTNLASDTTILLNVVSSGLSVAMRNFVLMVGGFIMLIFMNFELTMMIGMVIPVVLFPIITMGRKLRRYSKLSQDKLGDLTSISEETVYAIRTIQAYTKEKFLLGKFTDQLKLHMTLIYDRVSLRAKLTATVIGLVFGGIVIVLWYGGHQVLQGNITGGELTAFVYLSVITAAAVGAIIEVYGELQRAVGSLDRIFEFFDTESEIRNPTEPIKLPFKKLPSISFKNVYFAYPSAPDKLVLDDISFDIMPGKINALVGKSGAGKSTVFTLLERFYNVFSGAIIFNGVDISKVELKDIRSALTYVTQEPIIFSGTVYENIVFGNLHATKEQVYEAAKAACAYNFIQRMPEGFDSYIGEKGVRISGGQKQRIAIARAILSDPQVLLLDEATSSLDSENEELVQIALRNLMKGRTTIVIAHRLSTIMDADQILVLRRGKIVETGTHEKLIKAKGLYKKLVSLQFSKNGKKKLKR